MKFPEKISQKIAAFLLALLPAAVVAATDLASNGSFETAGEDGVPAEWRHQTDNGEVAVEKEGEESFARIAIESPGEDNFIQQTIPLSGKNGVIRLSAKYRYEGIVPGKQRHERGVLTARFTKNGKDTGKWLGIDSPSGSSSGWEEKSLTETIPDGVDGLMIRLGFYGAKAGTLDVANITAAFTEVKSATVPEENFRPDGEYGPEVSPERLANLKKGVNLSHWFAQAYNAKPDGKKGGYNTDHFARWITEKDADLIKSMGFDHVRLGIEVAEFMKPDGSLDPKFLPALDKAVAMFTGRGLAVKLDIHPKGKLKKLRSATMQNLFARFWSELASHLSTTDPDLVFLEILNEPSFGGQAWWEIQDRMITVIRSAAPEHTIIANPGSYQRAEDFQGYVPHPDRNVLHAFHYYSPTPFTHQGAMWMKGWYHPLRDIPWPLTNENLPSAVAGLDRSGGNAAKAGESEQVLRGLVKKNALGSEQMEKDFAILKKWSMAHDRHMVLGEFGVSQEHAPLESILRWAKATRESAERLGFGWSVWDYAGIYAVVENPAKPASRFPKNELTEALGL